MLRAEILATIVMIAPTPSAVLELARAGRALRLTPAQQFATRVAFRTLVKTFEQTHYELPNGVHDGYKILYYPNVGMLMKLEYYDFGKTYGRTMWWHTNGVLAAHYDTINGLSEGVERRWREDGQLWFECLYKNNHMQWQRFGHDLLTAY